MLPGQEKLSDAGCCDDHDDLISWSVIPSGISPGWRVSGDNRWHPHTGAESGNWSGHSRPLSRPSEAWAVPGPIDHVYWSLSSLLSADDGWEGSLLSVQCTVLSVNVMQSVMQHITVLTAWPLVTTPTLRLYPALSAPGEGNLNIPNWFPASHSVCFNYSPSSGPILNCINFKFSI